MKDIVDRGRPSASLVVPTREYRSPLNDTSDNTRTTKICENDIFHYPHKSICTFTYLIQVYRKNILARIDKQFPNRLTCYVLHTIAKMFTYRRNLSRFLVFGIYIFTYLIKIHIEKSIVAYTQKEKIACKLVLHKIYAKCDKIAAIS